jgi:hypothetical protein
LKVQDPEFEDAVREVRSAFLALKCELAAQRVLLAARGVARLLRKAGFNPDQLRDDRGRWTDTGAGEGAVSREDDPELILIGGTDGGSGRPVELLDEEAAGGHTVNQHVGKSDGYLLTRVRGEQVQFGIFTVSRKRAGSFPSVEAANKLVNATLAENAGAVAAVSAGKSPGAFITSEFQAPTGKEAYARTPRSEPYIRTTYGVGVLIAHDRRSPRGYRVITAYPRND